MYGAWHRYAFGFLLAGLLFVFASSLTLAKDSRFQIEEAGIDELHRAIQKGQTTCRGIVQAYIDRSQAYNGICTRLVTRDGAPIAAMPGTVRAGAPLEFPTETVAVGSLLPQFAAYRGLPIEYGRMAPTSSDPEAVQQYGMLVGMPDAGQVNALSTLNIRGERSVTCKGAFDAHPATGPLPPNAPAACEKFRQQPDALERAAELDKLYGRRPDLKQMPMYCAVFSFKDVFDATDMRTTGGADVKYAMDAPSTDSTLVAELRAKGAIIFAKANLAEYNGGSGNPGGDAKPTLRSFGAGSRSTWAGTACNPYDTERETGGSSSGSAASVAANLVTCSICEETGGSCRQPAWRNNVVGLVTTKGLLPYGGAIGAAMSDLVNEQIKKILRDELGAELVESFDPAYPDDPAIANMRYTFQQALAEILPFHMPEYLQSTTANSRGEEEGGDAEAKGDAPRFAVAGFDIGHRDYMVKAAEGMAPLSDKLNIRTVTSAPATASFSFHMSQYLLRRGDAWVKDWSSLNEHSKYYTESRTVAMRNWQNKVDLKSAGITQRVKMREVMRMVVNKVMQQNRVDVLVNPTTTIPPAKNGHAGQPAINNRPAGRFPTSADLGIPEITVPAGFNSVVYEPQFQLNAKQDNYIAKANDSTPTQLKHPLPVGISFWAGPGEEPAVIKVAAIYEQATRHRTAPPAFGAVQARP